MKSFGYFMAMVLILVLGMLWAGYVLSILWAWFMVPAFGLPAISIPLALGIALIVSYLTREITTDRTDKPYAEMLAFKAVIATLKPFFALITGWIIRLFV